VRLRLSALFAQWRGSAVAQIREPATTTKLAGSNAIRLDAAKFISTFRSGVQDGNKTTVPGSVSADRAWIRPCSESSYRALDPYSNFPKIDYAVVYKVATVANPDAGLDGANLGPAQARKDIKPDGNGAHTCATADKLALRFNRRRLHAVCCSTRARTCRGYLTV